MLDMYMKIWDAKKDNTKDKDQARDTKKIVKKLEKDYVEKL